jgi:hypothetical protein
MILAFNIIKANTISPQEMIYIINQNNTSNISLKQIPRLSSAQYPYPSFPHSTIESKGEAYQQNPSLSKSRHFYFAIQMAQLFLFL